MNKPCELSTWPVDYEESDEDFQTYMPDVWDLGLEDKDAEMNYFIDAMVQNSKMILQENKKINIVNLKLGKLKHCIKLKCSVRN